MRWLAEEHDLSSFSLIACLISDTALHSETIGALICSPSRAGSGNAHCTIRMSAFSTWDLIYDLIDACEKGNVARVRRAVADGVDVRKVIDKSWDNRTLLHHACWYVACETHPLI